MERMRDMPRNTEAASSENDYRLSITNVHILVLSSSCLGDTPMKLVTLHVPTAYLEGLEQLVDTKLYPNRSEAIRIAIRDLLKKELWN